MSSLLATRRMDKVTNLVSNSPSQMCVPCQVTPSHSSVALPPSPGHPGPSGPIDGHFDGSLTEKQACHGTGEEFIKGGRSRVTIDILPEDALLEIFDFYVDNARMIEDWQTLVHVCRKWRNVVFGSPRRLDLHLLCTNSTPVREILDVWPPIDIVVKAWDFYNVGVDNILAALKYKDRTSHITLHSVPIPQLEIILAEMQQPFPALYYLKIFSMHDAPSVQPDSFLGGSVPGLRVLKLYYFPFPGLPKLLLSATHLVHLELFGLTFSEYISPEAMVTGLSVLTRLESLVIIFHFSVSRLRWKSRPLLPLKPIVLPVLTKLHFGGACEYLDYLVAQIYVPLLDNLKITFFVQEIFDTPQFAQFVSRTPKFEAQGEARVEFLEQGVGVKLLGGKLKLEFACPINGHLSSLAQVCVSCLPQALIHGVERLYIFRNIFWPLSWEDNSINQWLEGLHPFTAVKDVYISQDLVPNIMRALHELVGERVTEFLPAMRTLFLADPPSSEPFWEWEEAIGHFVAARELAGHPFVVSRWVRKAGDE